MVGNDPDTVVISANLRASRYEFAAEMLRRLQGCSPSNIVFDIGTGTASLRETVEAEGWRWQGFDVSPVSAQITKWDLSSPCPAVEKADIGLLLDVLEHCRNPGLALGNIAATLRPAGWLVMTMPNPCWSRSRIHALLHGVPTCFTQSDLDHNGHVFTPWPHIVARLLADAGFDVVQYVTLDGWTVWPGRPISPRYPLRLLQAAANMLIERLDASACGMSYGLVARLGRSDAQPVPPLGVINGGRASVCAAPR